MTTKPKRGQAGGKATSRAKARAAKRNGKLGGRPRKQKHANSSASFACGGEA